MSLAFPMEEAMGICINEAPADKAHPDVEDFVAEVSLAAYCVVLQHGVGDEWLDLELDLWKALGETIKNRYRQAGLPGREGP
jgi:hypothetical protein